MRRRREGLSRNCIVPRNATTPRMDGREWIYGKFFSEKIVLEEMIEHVIVENNSLAETQRRKALMRWGKQEIRKA